MMYIKYFKICNLNNRPYGKRNFENKFLEQTCTNLGDFPALCVNSHNQQRRW